MLQAKSADGRLITIASFSRDQIKHIRHTQRFFCPTCHERVIIKAGKSVIPHFAHQAKSTCPSINYGEGAYHMKGKLLLYRWLRHQHIHVQLEPFINEINQIPDLLVTINEKKVALEFQCTRIPVEKVQQRNYGYKKVGITPIWILGKNLYKRKYRQLYINPFTLQFVHKYNESTPTLLYYFCPNTLLFYVVTNLFISTPSRAFHTLNVKNIASMTFKDLFYNDKMNDKDLLFLWKKEVRRFRLQQRHQAGGDELKWRTWLYNKKISIDQLPLYMHLPTQLQCMMKVPSWNWQSRLCLDIIHPLQKGNPFTLSQCVQLLKPFIYPQHFYPLINSKTSPIEQYLSYLQHLHIVKRKTTSHYQKEKDIQFNRNIEDSIRRDNVLINQLMYNCS